MGLPDITIGIGVAQMEQFKSKKYHAAVYLRISKEDMDAENGNISQSNSIINQKELIMNFLVSQPEIEVVSVRVDDGYSGTNFERPDFQKMLDDIKKGLVNCVVVKDLSRFGRNYIEVGNYIEKIFPALGIRFIAINDQYDSDVQEKGNDIIIPFKNLINDAYSRDISVKIRSHLEVKRKKGEFLGAFAVYGYRKSEENKNQLVIDDYAATVVQDIFRYKLSGYSQQKIANILNEEGVLSPMEYKKSIGMRYSTSFKTKKKAIWSSVAIGRILKNEVYIGTLVQGKQGTVNYRTKVRKNKKEQEWVRVDNAHEAIISKDDFWQIQEILKRDTRTAPKKEKVYPLSGILFCGDCRGALIRKTVPSGKRKYVYYVCAENKKNGICSSHSIRESKIEKIVLCMIQQHVQQILNMENIFQYMEENQQKNFVVQKLKKRIEKKQEELLKAQNLKVNTYEDLKDGVIDENDFQMLKEEFTQRIQEIEKAIQAYETEISSVIEKKQECQGWIDKFKGFQKIETLSRNIVVVLIDKIFVYEGERVEVVFKFDDEYKWAESFIEQRGLEIEEQEDK